MRCFGMARRVLWVIWALAACVPAAVAPTSTLPAPTMAPSATPSLPALTPTISADPQAVTFSTADGATLNGALYGSGDTAVIFSLMGSCKEGWAELAKETAKQGLLALTYQWRACQANSVDEVLIRKFLDDTRGAIEFVRAQGAERIILVGASLGGCASAKLAAEAQAVGLVVLAAPEAISDWGFRIDAADLATDGPKLFITAESDPVVPPKATRALYDLAAAPKEWQTYPGVAHGTDLLAAPDGDEVKQRILQFILAAAGQEQSLRPSPWTALDDAHWP